MNLICKIYFKEYRKSSEVLFDFRGCECRDDIGLVFYYAQDDELLAVFYSLSEIEDFNVMSV